MARQVKKTTINVSDYGIPDPQDFVTVGHNIAFTMSGNTLFITVDCSDDAKSNAPMSQSGKSKIVGSTSGFVRVNGVSFSLNVITK